MMRKKDTLFSSGRRRRKGQDYRNAAIGPNMGGYDAKGNTHTARSVKKAKAGAHAAASDASQRPARTYAPGEIDYVNPASATRESSADYARRQERKRRAIRPQSTVSPRSIVLVLLVAVAVVAFAFGVASCVFQGAVNSRLALQDAEVAEALVAPESAESPYYTLVAGTFHDAAQPDDGPDVLMLVRIDPQEARAAIVSIPSNLLWTLSDGSDTFISREETIGGDAGLVRTVSDFAGVAISHYAKVDAEGFVALVDSLGGIEVDVTEEVDDPDAGTIFIPAGFQSLNGAQALALCRAKNYLGSYDTRAQNQMKVLVALLQKASSVEGLGATQSTLDSIAGHFQTDLSVRDLTDLFARFASAGPEAVQMARVPGYTSYEGGTLLFSVAPSAWRTMMEKLEAGADPNEKSEAVQSVVPSEHTLTVKNGSGVTGAALQVADALSAAGYPIEETGNTDQFAYGETLVIYNDEAHAVAAEAVVDVLGVGRVVEAGIYYDFDTDLEVIVGQDWKPRG